MKLIASRLYLALLFFWVLFNETTAQACPDCSLQNSGGMIEPLTVVSKMAFSSSTLFMIGIFCTVLSFMVWIMVKTCRELTEQSKERPFSTRGEA